MKGRTLQPPPPPPTLPPVHTHPTPLAYPHPLTKYLSAKTSLMGKTVVHPELIASDLFLQLLSTRLKESNKTWQLPKKIRKRRCSIYSKKTTNFLQTFFIHCYLKKVNDMELYYIIWKYRSAKYLLRICWVWVQILYWNYLNVSVAQMSLSSIQLYFRALNKRNSPWTRSTTEWNI